MSEYIKSQKNGIILCYEGYKYRKDKQHALSVSWRCTTRGCKGRLLVKNDVKQVTTDHSHGPDIAGIEVAKAARAMREMSKTTDATPRQIMHACSSSITAAAAVRMPSYEACRKGIQRARRKELRFSAHFEQVSDIHIDDSLQQTIRGENFLLYDSGAEDDQRLLIFATRKNLSELQEFPHWAIDGTFKTCPLLFEQIFTIHAIIDGKAMPMVYALLTNRKEDTYVKLFECIKKFPPNLAPESILSDYELSSINAVRRTFPGCTIIGCTFHLAQNLWRKIQQFGLSKMYRDNEQFRVCCKKLLALAYVPCNDVQFSMEIISEQFPPEMQQIKDYWESTYVGRRIHNLAPRFSIDIWNMFDRVSTDLPMSNNSLEAWHNAFAQSLQCQHPHLFKLIDQLRKEQSATETYISRYKSGIRNKEMPHSKYVQLRKRLQNMASQYSFRLVEDYIQAVALNLTL